MNRRQKESVVEELKENFFKAKAAFVVNYRGLNVAQMQTLRNQLRNVNASMCVTKARLMKLATRGIEGGDAFCGLLCDQIGLVFVEDEPISVAKAVVEFAKQNDALKIVGGIFESNVMSQEQIKFFASIPSREALLTQFACVLQAPIVQFTQVLNTLLIKLILVLKEVEKKKNQ